MRKRPGENPLTGWRVEVLVQPLEQAEHAGAEGAFVGVAVPGLRVGRVSDGARPDGVLGDDAIRVAGSH